MDKVKQQASKLYKAMDWKEFDDKTKRVIITAREGQEYDELLGMTLQVSEETSLSTDSVYRFTMEALGAIADATGDTEDEVREAIYELEPDVYTSDLTEWLHESNYHVEYLTQAMQEYGSQDGFNALSAAQKIAMEEVAGIVLERLIKNTSEQMQATA